MKTNTKQKGLTSQDKKHIKSMRQLRKNGRGKLWTTKQAKKNKALVIGPSYRYAGLISARQALRTQTNYKG